MPECALSRGPRSWSRPNCPIVMTVKVDVSGSEVVLFAARPVCCSSCLLLVLFAAELSIFTSRTGFVVESEKRPIEPPPCGSAILANQPTRTGWNGSDRESHKSTATHPNHPRHPSHPRLNFARSATPANRDQGARVMSPNIAFPLPALPSLSSFPSVQTLLVNLSPRNPNKNLFLPGFHPVVGCRYPAPAAQ